VTSSPSGIDCGSTCSSSFSSGTSVTLTALASGTSVFVGWAGACGGAEPICTLTMDENKAVTAIFLSL
jgi:endoglucanase